MANSLYIELDKRRLSNLKEENKPIHDGYPSEFSRDFSRLVHSPSFRRLTGKMQIYPTGESDFFRNRLTHTLEVGDIAYLIAHKLNTTPFFIENKIDLDLITFSAHAHDLGHPPFGHDGERALDECMANFGRFEGNAQTLRILLKLEKKI